MPVSEVTGRSLEEGVRRMEEQRVGEALRRMREILTKIPPEEIVSAVRSSREER